MVKWITVKFATVNDDFTDQKTNLPLVAKYCHVMLTQENKHDVVRRFLPSDWRVFQVLRSASTRGSAVCWRVKGPFRLGSTDQREAVRGRGILPRRLTIVHGRVGTAPVTFIATHRPIRRTRLQPAFDRVLALYCTVLRARKRYVVIGLDANERNPQQLARRCGLNWIAPKGSIDGFLISRSLRVAPDSVKRLPKWHSDHAPVLAHILFPTKEGV